MFFLSHYEGLPLSLDRVPQVCTMTVHYEGFPPSLCLVPRSVHLLYPL
ncbi:unnamed protein product [Staurois parvus]|uniref:Uncharacterized protein n=1 Tax=Staurois parvus TaxID=386267 RepID=A0ABN9CZS5_9NEOB|nr:unnamed protein product [Staurois parvus]